MDEQFDLRAFLVKLQDGLSENDRRRLHFIVGNTIPRHLRDDPTLGGTLSLLESLFDRAKISEQDFDYLIQIFQEIHCWDGVKRLQEYQKCKKQTFNRRETIASDLIQDNETDGIIMNNLSKTLPRIEEEQEIDNSSENASVTIKTTKKTVNITLTFIKQTLRSRLTTCQLILLILNILAILSVVVTTVVLKKQSCSKSIHTENILLIKEGTFYGDSIGGDVFDDALSCSLTLNDQLVGINITWSYDTIASLSFIYSNEAISKHGYGDILRPPLNSSIFSLLSVESINGVTIYQGIRDIINTYKPNGTNIIVGIQFFTNRGRQSEIFGSTNGTMYTETYPDYKLTYVRGRSYAFIDALQFVWTKTYAQSIDSMIGSA